MKMIRISLLACVLVLFGCAPGQKILQDPSTPKNAILTGEAVVCVIEHVKEPLSKLLDDCNIPQTLAADVTEVVASVGASNQKAAAAAGAAAGAAAPCAK